MRWGDAWNSAGTMSTAAQIGHDLSLAEHPFVARLSRLMAFSATDLENLERIVESERLVKRRQDLVVAGSAYRSLCFVKDGYAIRYKLLRSGKRQILNVILPGDVIGFPVSFFDRSIYSIVAVSDLTYNICSLDRLCTALLRAAAVWLGVELACCPRSGDLCGTHRRSRPAHATRTPRAFSPRDSRPLAGCRARGGGQFPAAVFARGHGRCAGLERSSPQSSHATIARRTIDHQPFTRRRIDGHDGPADAGAVSAVGSRTDFNDRQQGSINLLLL